MRFKNGHVSWINNMYLTFPNIVPIWLCFNIRSTAIQCLQLWKFQIFIFLIGYINVNKGVFCLIMSYLRIKSYNVLNYNNCSTDWHFPLSSKLGKIQKKNWEWWPFWALQNFTDFGDHLKNWSTSKLLMCFGDKYWK
jgi:hypothetical protein